MAFRFTVLPSDIIYRNDFLDVYKRQEDVLPYQCEPEVNMNSVGGSHLDFGVNWRGFWFRDKIKYHIWMI